MGAGPHVRCSWLGQEPLSFPGGTCLDVCREGTSPLDAAVWTMWTMQ